MKKHIETEIYINAPVEHVWAVFTDFHSYPTWSPTLRKFSSDLIPGQKVRVRLEQPDGPGMTMYPMVLRRDENSELRWKGQLLMPGLFDGEHYFSLVKISESQTRFIQGEYFSGILVGLFRKMIEGATINGFHLFNQALKDRVESAYKN